MTEDTAERRRDVRASVSVMGTVEGPAGENPIVVLNLSASGAMIQADEPPEPGSQYTLRFSLHKVAYELPFKVVGWLQQGDAYGWRGPFVGHTPEQAQAIERAVHAAAGLAESAVRPWDDVLADAQSAVEVLVATTPAGQEVRLASSDVLEMGPEGLELYARLMCELETM